MAKLGRASLAEIKGYQSPSEVPTRKEVRGLVMVGKSGEPVHYMAIVERDGKNVSLGETFVHSRSTRLEVCAVLPSVGSAHTSVLDYWLP